MDNNATQAALEQITNLAAAVMMEDLKDHQGKKHVPFAPRVKALIEHSLATKNKMLLTEDVAEKLHVSPQTLRRLLVVEETSYRKLADESRRQIAEKLLTETSMKMDELAEMLDFSAPSGFTRAFTDWTGVAPTDFRKKFGNPDLCTRQTLTHRLGKVREKRNGTATPTIIPVAQKPITSLFTDEPKPEEKPNPPPAVEVAQPTIAVVAAQQQVTVVEIKSAPPAVVEAEEEPEQEFIPAEHIVSYAEQKNDHHLAVRSVRLFLDSTSHGRGIWRH